MPPPKRMSDILASSSTCPPTTSPSHAPPYSSDGPTLPLLSAHTTKLSSADKNRKRKRTVDQAPQPHPHHLSSATHGVERRSPQPHRAHHPKLYEPWTLLPGKLEREVKKLGQGKGKGGVEVLVFSRNQNVKAAVNKLRVLLSSHNDGTENRDEGGNEDGSGGGSKTENAGIIAISAQGEGTVKLVGILELVRRIIGEPSNNGAPTTRSKEEGKDERARKCVKWHTYTLLSSVAVPRAMKITPASPRKSTRHTPTAPPNKVHHNNAQSTHDSDPMQPDTDDDAAGIARTSLNDIADVDGDGDVEIDVEVDGDGDVTSTSTSNQERGKTRILPVLTIWISRSPIPGFRDAGGEGEEVLV